MPRRIVNTTLNASSIDILNVIRQNAPYEYQQNVPEVTSVDDIPRVGEVIYGTPAFANHFLTALINRIAIVRTQSATFNNPYARLKKGYLEFGETVEDIFVSIAQVITSNVEEAPAREFKRTLPDVRSAFHVMNWKTIYPVTIQDEDLKQAFLSVDGVTDLIAKIVDSVYTGAEYDEFLLFKYLLIKAVSHGKVKTIKIGDGTDFNNMAANFRGISNLFQFLSDDYNENKAHNNTPKNRQVIFMDALFNAQFDVNVLASAFNMDKANFLASLYLIDDWTTFDNKRFEQIRATSDMIEEVTSAELTAMKNVKAIIVDENWFQVYDNNNKFTEKYVASGLYWNYFYHVWKTISYSPFANIVAFSLDAGVTVLPSTLTLHIDSKDESEIANTVTFSIAEKVGLAPNAVNFTQTDALTKAGIAVHKFGGLIIPASQVSTPITVECVLDGTVYKAATTFTGTTVKVGQTITLNKQG